MADIKYIEGYPEYMYELINVVEKSRGKRKDYVPKAMTMEEREEVLKLHPDFAAGGKRKIKIGVNKGDIAPNEVADLLEAYPLIEEGDVDLEKPDFVVDVMIIGGGLAGTTAGIWANMSGISADRILLVNKLRHGDCNSIMAEGGTQAADRENDSPIIHFVDAMGGGHFTNKPDVLEALVTDGPLVIQWLEQLGVLFDRNEDGSFVEIWGGGTCRRRMHACKDYTGLEEFRVIKDEFKSRGIPIVEHSPVIELLTDDGKVTGAVLVDLETSEYKVVKAKTTIIATGGFGRLHVRGFPTTNHYGATFDGPVVAYRAGAKLKDTDTVQYHPTGAVFPPQIVGHLLTEKLRSMGAQPVNIKSEAFVFPLEPRDVEASAIIRECYVRNNGVTTPAGLKGVWLDIPLIDVKNGKGTIEKAFPGMKRMFGRFDIDITKNPVLIFPTLHYQNGGIETNPWGRTNLKGLWVAGEASGGVHGKNRLMGNSTLDCIVFGRRSGISVADYVKSSKTESRLSLHHLKKYVKMLKDAGIPPERKAPILLPDYRGKRALARSIEIF